jgi:hypothetical protein
MKQELSAGANIHSNLSRETGIEMQNSDQISVGRDYVTESNEFGKK